MTKITVTLSRPMDLNRHIPWLHLLNTWRQLSATMEQTRETQLAYVTLRRFIGFR